jgi:hypothetical protein
VVGEPKARNLLANSVIEAGARKGQTLGNGGYLAPDVSYDGRQIVFSYTDGEPQVRVWNERPPFTFSVASQMARAWCSSPTAA